MFIRAVVAFLALPGIVAFAVPILIALSTNELPRYVPFAVVVIALGTLLLLCCVHEFYVIGRGTLAPSAPPQRLVTTGLYQFSRNPMYVALTIILIGWNLLFSSRILLVYAVIVLCAAHLRVLLYEEPLAGRHFGAEWHAYAARVPRYIRLALLGSP